METGRRARPAAMTADRLLARLAALEREREALRAELQRLGAGAGGGQAGCGGVVTLRVRCPCGAALHAAGHPGLGVAILHHGGDRRALALEQDDPLLPRVPAGDPAVLEEPPLRAWLRGYHPEP